MRGFLALLVGLFPAPFRRQFAPDMIRLIDRDYDRAMARGHAATLRYSAGMTLDLVWSGGIRLGRPEGCHTTVGNV